MHHIRAVFPQACPSTLTQVLNDILKPQADQSAIKNQLTSIHCFTEEHLHIFSGKP